MSPELYPRRRASLSKPPPIPKELKFKSINTASKFNETSSRLVGSCHLVHQKEDSPRTTLNTAQPEEQTDLIKPLYD